MMLKLTEIAPRGTLVNDVLTLPYELRQKSRFSATTDNGMEVGMFLSRGQTLRSGVVLTGEDDFNVQIKAAPEMLSIMRSQDTLQLARACYHLGNRHVPLQILAGELRFLNDHVLDQMLNSIGLTVTHEMQAFDPESGAYHSHEQ